MVTTWPKQLVIRNTPHGAIWQCYHVKSELESSILTSNSKANGFLCVTLTDVLDVEETSPGWRDTDGWKECLKIHGGKSNDHGADDRSN